MNINEINTDRFKETAFLRISIKRFGNRAKVKDDAKLQEYLRALHATEGDQPAQSAIQNGDSSKSVNTTKILIKSEPLDALNRYLTETKNSLVGKFGKANPSRLMDGLFVVALPLVAEFEDVITKARQQMSDTLIPAAVADYEASIERAEKDPVNKGGLGPLFNRLDYITIAEFAQQFGIDTQWLTLKPADELPPEIRAKNEKEFAEKMNNAWETIGSAMQVAFLELIEHAADKLKPGPDGKGKVWRDSTLTNLQAFCDCFDSRNITNDKALAELVGKAQEILIGADPKALRKDINVRDATQKKFEEIKASLEVEVKRNRRFDLNSD